MTWTSCFVGDLVARGEAEVKTGPFGTQLHASDYVEHGTPVINVRNIGFGTIRPEKLEFISNETVRRLSTHLLRPKDIVFGRKGAVERHVYIKDKHENWFQGSDCLRLRLLSEKSALSLYLSYCFLTEYHKRWMMQQCSHGATMASLNQDIIKRIPLLLPPLPTQRRIASVLSAYDDLIENNTRRIAILEEMARRLYEEWFVQFRFPGHEDVEFVEGELGSVPAHWPVKRLDELIDFNPKTKVPKEGDKLFVPMSALSGNSLVISGLETKAGNSGAKFQNGDTLVARITPCLENGKTGYVDFLPPDQPTACGSTEYIVLRSNTLCPEMVYCIARSVRFRDIAIKSMSGASGRQRVQEDSLREILITQPDNSTLASFRKMASPAFKQVSVLARKNANLRAQRDLLLPKLISGEIDVSDTIHDLGETET